MLDRPTLLIIDDFPANIKVLHGALEEEYEVLFATRGAEGLRMAREYSPDLILLDIMMPGMDGYEVCSHLKSQPLTRSIPIIFITALSQHEDEMKGLKLGAIDYITKPFNPIIVKARVKNHLALKRSRQELEKANIQLSRLASIVKATADFVGIFNVDYKLIYLNQGGRTMVGLSNDERVDTYTAMDFFPKDIFLQLQEEVFPHISTGGTWSGEVSILAVEKRLLPVSMVGFSVPRTHANPAYFGVILRDITEMKGAQEALKRSQTQLNSILVSMQEVVYSALLDGQLIFINPAAEEIFGLPLESFYHDPEIWFKVIIPEDRDKAKEIFEEIYAKGSASVEYRIYRPDGSLRWLDNRCRLIYDEEGEIERMDGVIMDITHKKEAEASLHAQLELEKMVAIISRNLLSSSIPNIGSHLEEVLSLIGSFFSVDHTFIYLLPSRERDEDLFRYVKDKSIPPFSAKGLSWLVEKLKGREYLQIEATSLSSEERLFFLGRSIFSSITIPFLFHEDLLGFLSLERKKGSFSLSSERVSALVIISEMITNAIKKKEYQEEISQYAQALEKKSQALEDAYSRLEEDIEKARYIHSRTLPRTLPRLAGYSFAAHYQPAENLGGDLYNVIRLKDHLILYILDVTGHGLDGAMMSFFIKNTISSIISSLPLKSLSPESILTSLAKTYYQGGFPDDYFLCIFIGVLDMKSGLLSYTGAGFQALPLVFHSEEKESVLLSQGLPISSVVPLKLMDFKEDVLEILPGTIILFTTDGLVEQIAHGEEYNSRLKTIFYSSIDLPSELIKERINKDFSLFNGSLQGKDDITFFVFQYHGEEKTLSFQTSSRIDAIPMIRERILRFVEERTEVEVDWLSIHELLVNAMEHGNGLHLERQIFIEVLADQPYVQVTIEDEGEGFDWQSYFSREDGLKKSGERGRGLFMVKRMAHHLSYNEKGNEVKVFFVKE